VARVTFYRFARIAAGSIVVALLTIRAATTTDVLNDLLISPLADRFQRAKIGDPQTITGVIALDGDYKRIQEAGRLARQWPHSKFAATYKWRSRLLFSLVGEGIAPERVLIEQHSRNTYEDAKLLTTAVKPKPGEYWLLVTSAVHMPRAIGAFRQNGFMVEPWPTYGHWSNDYGHALHEWIGLVVYWMRGRTSDLFPAPSKPAPNVASSTSVRSS
jgi:uncharacterized SAM-binding protein YcdF (DUF218 family)